MPFGLLTGLGAALSWGTMDIATRPVEPASIGSLRVTAGGPARDRRRVPGRRSSLVIGTTIPTDPPLGRLAALLGLIGAGAYFAYFTGLRIGPISVVSGMVAAYGGLTVVLSVVVPRRDADAASRPPGRRSRRSG